MILEKIEKICDAWTIAAITADMEHRDYVPIYFIAGRFWAGRHC